MTHRRLYDETRDVLDHFYDQAYLLQHPLVQQVSETSEGDAMVAVQRLRRTLLNLVERLRPGAHVDMTDAAWRPYLSLHRRYILGKSLAEVAEELNLGTRQVQREQSRGMAALAAMLEEELTAAGPSPSDGGEALRQEISRASTPNERFDVRSAIENAVASIRPWADEQQVHILCAADGPALYASGTLSLFRQLVIAALSTLIRYASPRAIEVSARYAREHIICTLMAHAMGDTEVADTAVLVRSDTVVALAEAQDVIITVERDQRGLCLSLAIPTNAARPVIAIIEDNRDLVRLFSRYLMQVGLSLVEVANTPEGLTELNELAPHVIVLDVMMAGADGWELLQHIKANPRLSRVPVLVCSVLDQPELARSLGASAYLRKPVRPPELLSEISRLLNRPHSVAESSDRGQS